MAYYKTVFGKKLKYGKKFRFRSSLKLLIEPGGKVIFGDNCFVNNHFSATSLVGITIGNDCIIGENVKIYDHNHRFADKGVLIRSQGFKSEEVFIGNNCWIASNVTILAGVHIGDNCVIGANCLIYKDVPSGSIVKHKEDLMIIRENEEL